MNARADVKHLDHLSNAHLDALEEEAIFILREVAAAFERPRKRSRIQNAAAASPTRC
jgi:3'-phosphoadenosine 5'-phosphosulfate sulfotransferase (PAPS reductase)/FAD synthetase